MKVVYSTQENKLARVYVAELNDGSKIEFVESTQPPHTIDEKWVLIVSTLKGCPVSCSICDAGSYYSGVLTSEEILSQINYMVEQRYPDKNVKTAKFKIQFSRIGEPAFNDNVLDVLKQLPALYDSQKLLPSLSTIAPRGRDSFFKELIDIKNEFYSNGKFQLQFSIHTSCEQMRKKLIPANTWNFKEISEYVSKFFSPGDRKVTLNFATPVGYPLDVKELKTFFDPKHCLIKLTPVNPTDKSLKNHFTGLINPETPDANDEIIKEFMCAGYDAILSIGELEENIIGSNCGMYLNHNEYSL